MSQDIAKALSAAFDRHGFAFQEAVLEATRIAFDHTKNWALQTGEFPVTVGGQDSRTDFILEHRSGKALIVGECKRANRRFSSWAFAKSRFAARNLNTDEFYATAVRISEIGHHSWANSVRASIAGTFSSNFAIPVKSGNSTGDSGPESSPQTLENAFSQVSHAAYGLVEHLMEHRRSRLREAQDSIVVIPLLVTTADLWTVEFDRDAGALESGMLKGFANSPQKSSWLFHQHLVSESHLPTRLDERYPPTLTEALRMRYFKTVPVVQGTSLAEFLRRFETVVDDLIDGSRQHS